VPAHVAHLKAPTRTGTRWASLTSPGAQNPVPSKPQEGATTTSRHTDLTDLHLSLVIADVEHDPAWVAATPDEQLGEVLHRLGERAVATFAEARAALVAAMETRLLKTIDDGSPGDR